jgi:hypothetical protein
VTSHGARGVIFAPSCAAEFGSAWQRFGDPVIGYWQPPATVIDALEASLRPALESGRSKPESVARMSRDARDRAEEAWGIFGAIEEILAHFGEYRRQYAGIVVRGGARRVLVSCFREDVPREFPHWDTQWVEVDDGGASFWRIQYDVDSGRFLGFEMNPSG